LTAGSLVSFATAGNEHMTANAAPKTNDLFMGTNLQCGMVQSRFELVPTIGRTGVRRS